MAKGPVVPPEKRQEYVDYALKVGVDECVEKYGLNKKTLRTWISKAGLSTALGQKRQKAVEASQATFELRRANLKNKILDEAEAALDDMRKEYTHLIKTKEGDEIPMQVAPEPGDRAKLATAFGILFDKLQLSTGGPTSNTTVDNPSLKALIDNKQQQNAIALQALAEATQEGTGE